jgi:hyperosmotically inducible protein
VSRLPLDWKLIERTFPMSAEEHGENPRATRRGRWKYVLAMLLALIIAGAAFAHWQGMDLLGGLQNARTSTEEAATTARVKAAFMLSSRVSVFDIDVDTAGDIVTLRGRVSADDVRELAGEIARDVTGGADVRNDIEVITGLRPDPELDELKARVEELEIKTSIASAISSHPRLTTSDIKIQVAGGKVTLTGAVGDAEDKLGVERVALATDGVHSVVNEIALKQPEPEKEGEVAKQDRRESLTRRVAFALYATDAFDLEPIEIRVSDESEVTLAGVVRSRAEALLAERVVREVEGVEEVTNSLEVGAGSEGIAG